MSGDEIRLKLLAELENSEIMKTYNEAFLKGVTKWGENHCETSLTDHLADAFAKAKLI